MSKYSRQLGNGQDPYYGGLWRKDKATIRPVIYPEDRIAPNWLIIGLALLLAIAGLTFILGLAFM